MAKTTVISAKPPLLIHILLPFKIRSSASNVARVFNPAASEPLSASDRAKAASFGPSKRGAKKRSFCSSLEATKNGVIPSSEAIKIV